MDLDGDPRSEKELQAAAHHEAGHAVAAWCYQLAMGSINIERNQHGDGVCYVDSTPRMEFMVHLLAGGIAEVKYSGERAHDRSDRVHATKVARELCTNKLTGELYTDLARDLLGRCEHVARCVVDDQWECVQLLARHLRQKICISAPEAQQTIEGLLSEDVRTPYGVETRGLIGWWWSAMNRRHEAESHGGPPSKVAPSD